MESTVEMLRSAWRAVIERSGGHCPVCDRWGKVYARPINRTMARSLIWLCHATPDETGWVNVPNVAPRWLVQSNQLPTLRWWGLVDRKRNDGETKTKHSGLWLPTADGLDFVNNHTRVPKQVFTYNDTVQGYSTDTVSIEECFDDMFDYNETMSSFVPSTIRRA